MKLPWLLGALLGAGSVASLAPVKVVGNKFFTSAGSQFFIKGIAYQLTADDPLVNTEQCSRDAGLMATLGTNAIRVYHVDSSKDHAGCMKVFADVGIYVLVDLDTFDTYILPEAPGPYWNLTQYSHYAATMDAFASFDNTLGFFVGNEVIDSSGQSGAAPYIKAAARDMKAYRRSKGYREIPVGYSAADIAQLRPMLQDYLTCGGNASETVDFFALNSYEWCDPATYLTSGYANLEAGAVSFPVPIFFSETGCNVPGPRLFADQEAIFGVNMSSDWSGAIIYEWIEETNHYGLISYAPPVAAADMGSDIAGGFVRAGTPTPILPDFTNLKSAWAAATPTGVSEADYQAHSVSTRACPGSTSGGWLLNGNVALPSFAEVSGSEGTVKPAGATGAPSVPSTTSGSTASPTLGSATTKASAVTGSAAQGTSSIKNPAPANNQMASMSVALTVVLLFFTYWL